MLRVVLALLTVGITLFAFVDCLRCSDAEVRRWPRQLWCLITLIPLLGGLAWLLYGSRPETTARLRPTAPDDDPEFLRSLDLRWQPDPLADAPDDRPDHPDVSGTDRLTDDPDPGDPPGRPEGTPDDSPPDPSPR